jgi:hypothetical protein
MKLPERNPIDRNETSRARANVSLHMSPLLLAHLSEMSTPGEDRGLLEPGPQTQFLSNLPRSLFVLVRCDVRRVDLGPRPRAVLDEQPSGVGVGVGVVIVPDVLLCALFEHSSSRQLTGEFLSSVEIDVCGVLLCRVQIRAHQRLDTLSGGGVVSESLVGGLPVTKSPMNSSV